MTFLLLILNWIQSSVENLKENANSSEYPVYTIYASIDAYTCAHTHIHFSLSSRVHTQWLLERETAMYIGIRKLARVCVRANRRFTQTRSIVLRGMRTEMCIYPRAYVYVDP